MVEKSEYQYKFSIIISIYNVEEYLKEAIDSVISQSIGFKENIQLILVNDGSPDNSEEICLLYKEKYPDNVVYVKKENGGLSSAKNYGLKFRKGQYVNFFDPDDILAENTLEEVYKFFSKNENTISMIGIPLVFFEAQKGLHPKYKYLGKQNRVIILDIEPYNFILSSASAFYKTEIFDELSFDEEMVGEEDTKLNFKIYEKDHCFGYVCEKNVQYNYRKRKEGGSIVDNSTTNVNNFLSVISLLDEVIGNKNKDDLPNYIKELIVYETKSRIKCLDKELLGENYEMVVNRFRKYVELVGPEYIVSTSKWLTEFPGKVYYLKEILKGEKYFNISPNGFFRYKDLSIFPINRFKVEIKKITTRKNCIYMDLFFSNYGMENLKLIIKNKDGEKLEIIKDINVVDSSFNTKYGLQNICESTRYKIEIPYQKEKFSFYVLNEEDGKEYKLTNIAFSKYTKLYMRDKEMRVFYKKYNLKYFNAEFIMKKYTYPTWKYNYNLYKRLKKKYNYKSLYRFFNKRTKKYILINDRPEKAGDNGEAIFKYINKNEKQLAKYTYYVINNKNKDYKRMKKYGKVVKLNSIKHKLLFLNSKVVMSSHTFIPFYSAFETVDLAYYRDCLNYIFVWLQHGITQNDISYAANQYAKGIDYVVLATNNEKEEFSKDKYFYDENNLLLAGFSRYDYLDNKPQNIITIAPTWRTYLSGDIKNDGYHETKKGFVNSDYYCNYANLLKDERMLNVLKKNNIKINFVLHPGMAGYEELFKQFENETVTIIGTDKVNYSKVFAESNLLITDYSSVFFDFAYLKKPVIYYQFDKEKFYSEHYKAGYFNVATDGFGDVLVNGEDVIEKIYYYIQNNFKMEDKYLKRVDNTFKYTDKNNCKRLIRYLRDNNVIK